MKNKVLNDIVEYAKKKLNENYGYCGVALTDDMAMTLKSILKLNQNRHSKNTTHPPMSSIYADKHSITPFQFGTGTISRFTR